MLQHLNTFIPLIGGSGQFDLRTEKYTPAHRNMHALSNAHAHTRGQRAHRSNLFVCVLFPWIFPLCGVNTCTVLSNIPDT